MRVLHAAALLRPPSGIIRQMEWEQQAANELNIKWDARMYCPIGMPGTDSAICVQSDIGSSLLEGFTMLDSLRRWVSHRRSYARWIESVSDDYDILLLRYYVHDPYQLSLLKSLKKPVFLVHHSKEIDELSSAGFRGMVRAQLEETIGKKCIDAAKGSVAVTNEILQYEAIRSQKNPFLGFVYPNGIPLGEEVVPDRRSDVPELLFVAGAFPAWHGLDLLLDSLERSMKSLTLHLVGNLGKAEALRAKRDPRIVVHGHLDREKIRDIASRCHVGLSSFALDRKGMLEACTLKVREYLAFGLPVYAGHRDVFPEDFPYFRMGGACVDSIIEYAKQCANVDRESVSVSASKYIDKKSLLMTLYSELLPYVEA